jgi:hypothetical protein
MRVLTPSPTLLLFITLVAAVHGGFWAEQMAWGQTGSAQSSTDQKPEAKPPLHFSVIVAGETIEDGVRMGTTEYRSSDGVPLQMTYGHFPDPDHATAKFEKVLSTAVKIVERRTELDQAGKAIGQRAQVIIPASKPNQTIPAILWTDGPQFHEISAISLPDILELEKQYKTTDLTKKGR